MDDFERRYSTKDIAGMLGVEAVTIRKYAMALEKAGYVIERSDGKNRSYSERDAMAFKFLQSIRARTSVTVEEAAMVTVQRGKADTVTAVHVEHSEGDALPERYDERYTHLMSQMAEYMKRQEDVNQTLIKEIHDQRAYIEQSIQQRDEKLMIALRELTEAKKEAAAAKWWKWWK